MNAVECKIKLRPKEVNSFVAAAMKCNFEIDIAYNRFIVDAKSILGVLGLDFTKTLTVRYSGYDAEFEKFLKTLAIAC